MNIAADYDALFRRTLFCPAAFLLYGFMTYVPFFVKIISANIFTVLSHTIVQIAEIYINIIIPLDFSEKFAKIIISSQRD